MKNQLTTLLLAGALLAGCDSKPERNGLEAEVEAYMLKNAHDPESYEFISLVPSDTFFLHEDYFIRSQIAFKKADKELGRAEELLAINKTSPYHQKYLERADALSSEGKAWGDKMDSVLKSSNRYAYRYIIYKHEARAKNKLGALEKMTYYVSAGPDGKLLKVAESEKGLE